LRFLAVKNLGVRFNGAKRDDVQNSRNSPSQPCPAARDWRIRQGQAVVAGLFVALRIFPAVVGQLVFVELRHEYECAADVDVSNIDVPVLMRGE
jgi:hypothetical protein